MPYLPIDPVDVGRSYEAVIRVNSQSGKGGVAYPLRAHAGHDLPPRMRPGFARVVQEATDDSGREGTGTELAELFRATYPDDGELLLSVWPAHPEPAGGRRFVCTLESGGRAGDHEGAGEDTLAACADALAGAGYPVDVLETVVDGTGGTEGGPVTAYAECRAGGRTVWGRGRGPLGPGGVRAGGAVRGEPGGAPTGPGRAVRARCAA
ncbi:hypothetical protein AB0E77_24645 [Streptomyces sp. NPDC032940]|uniref:hypothetical protein n=1 Tax=Streptomyces sp. NPDC032940 TaxID=3155366 RepID=UPI003408DC59